MISKNQSWRQGQNPKVVVFKDLDKIHRFFAELELGGF